MHTNKKQQGPAAYNSRTVMGSSVCVSYQCELDQAFAQFSILIFDEGRLEPETARPLVTLAPLAA